ncbi:cell surface protein SprA [Aquimarina sp. MMG016]|uniref:T9SS outer membrane translocon Sov/SprA n=1 Tax=Aquimarina sp. MMG016 TaxID=2822690 RepID=UPI001B3A53E2|nr:cell surface protein SprA [Aquimarina sp. MMG016]MBQ4818685.1 cell surface protein SprA [Aquimarina sp. MMG016]
MGPSTYLRFIFFKVIICLIALSSTGIYAQDTEKVRDSTSTTHTLGEIYLPDPNSIVAKYEYDPITNRYIYREMLGDFNVRYPLFLTPKEYEALVEEEQRRSYFKEKIEAFSGKTDESEGKRKNLLPIFYVKSNLFESIFGGNEIEIIPQGSVEMDLGVLYTKQDNPAFSPRNRSNFTFDFDQRISLSLLGKIGKRLQITANYDTESTFDFQNQIKLEYTPTEDDIIRSIEVGNVTMPLNSSLIQGAQSLFGVKMGLQFGNTTVTGVYSEQRSETRSVNVQGGGTVQNFEVFASQYDENRHFFLAHYFRDTYDDALRNYPFINNNIQINRIEVWVTNRATSAQTLTNARNIVALQDLGESPVDGNFVIDPSLFNRPAGSFADNTNNDLNPFAIGPGGPITEAVRQISTVQNGFVGATSNFQEGLDYAILENARQLTSNEYTLNTQLGYISLNQRLNNDETLAVAFQYTVAGQVYQVGEFSIDGVDATVSDNPDVNDPQNPQVGSSRSLVVKMLKSPITNVQLPIWDLMMKNIYSTGAFRLEQNDFRLNILYTDPSPLNYITAVEGSTLPADVDQTTLLQVFNMDRLNPNRDPVAGGDGFFDYVPGLTVDTENGRIIFTSVEPFGEHLFNKLDDPNVTENYNDPGTYNPNQAAYVYRELYTQTNIIAEQQAANKNKFQLKGSYKSSSQDGGIPLGAFNVPQGSVTVTAGGRVLQEGVDYTVNYQLGRVNILDESLLASNTPIQVSTENNAVFGQQTKRFTGINIEHKFSDDFIIGGTYLNLNERPITQKSNYNFEPINNTILGFNLNYATEVPFLTRMVNKLPNIDTDVPSNISVRAEVARLIAGAPKGADFDGKVTTYIDDFEGAQTAIDVSSPLSWELSSVPAGFGNPSDPNSQIIVDGIESGNRRAKLAWYSIDPIFYSNSRPSGIDDTDLSFNGTRRIFNSEIFPQTDIVQGQTLALFTMDLNYIPTQRGPYNFSDDAQDNVLTNPENNFGGIIRQLTSTNFEQSNVEFIEFWLLDPFWTNGGTQEALTTSNEGRIVFNLGNISEDVLKDGRKQYENGLPAAVDPTFVPGDSRATSYNAQVPINQSLIYAFDSDGAARTIQDAGYDGLTDDQEREFFPDFDTNDPAADNYQYYLQADGSIQNRYLNYNGVQGNSPTDVANDDRGNTALPTVEDVNRDNTMNTINSYFQYTVPIFEGMGIGNDRGTGYISDVIEDKEVSLQNGQIIRPRWVRFKIPISIEDTNPNDNIFRGYEAINGASDFRSIRFMRMFLTGFDSAALLRFGTLDLVRGDYRRYLPLAAEIDAEGLNVDDNDVIVTSVSEEETVNYVTPPGVFREQLINNNSVIREDERSLALTVNDLDGGDARGVYKNFNVDMRQYENLEMFLHAEELQLNDQLDDNELVAFIRMGNDFTNNFYQIEVPLQLSPFDPNNSNPNPDVIWPSANRLELPLSELGRIKSQILVRGTSAGTNPDGSLAGFEVEGNNGNIITVRMKGNPSIGNVRVMMVGVKNSLEDAPGNQRSGTVWFNEMRLSDLKNQGGWAAVGSMDGNIADFANVSASGRISTIGFGGIEQGPNERSIEDVMQYDLTTDVNLGQLLPKKWGMQIPFNYSRGEELITPQYDQFYEDLELQDNIDNAINQRSKDSILNVNTEYTKRQSFNVIGLRKDRTGDAKPMPYDVENFTFSGTYNQTDHRDFEIEKALDQSVRLGGTYDFSFQPKEVEPLKNIKFLGKSKYFSLLKDFNFNLLPTSVNVSSNINRQYNEQTFRDLTRGEGFLEIPKLTQRTFLFDWQYGFNYNLTKSLNFNFTSANNRIVKNFINNDGSINDNIGVWSGLFDIGDPNTHSQQLQVNYDIPFSKVPLLKFMRGTYTYSADFQWTKGSEALKNLEGIPDLGNTIQNANVHTINGSLDMNTLYKYVGLTKKKPGRRKAKKKKGSAKEEKGKAEPKVASASKGKPKRASNKLSVGAKAYNTLIGLVTAVKKVNINYQQDNGIFLPGYLREPGFVGTLKPSLGFTFGSQAEIRDLAARNGWLTLYDDFNQQYREVEGREFRVQASVGLLKDLTIDISANRNYQETYSENYRVQDNNPLDDVLEYGYESLAPNTFGNFTISTNLIKTAFKKSDEFTSETFEEFRQNRQIVADRLATEFYGTSAFPRSEEVEPNGYSYPVGFGKTNQAVLLPAFLSAYSGSNAEKVKKGAFRDIPLPNWDVKYTGLMRIKWFKKRFKRFSMAHGYRANYTINQFQTNLDFDSDAVDAIDQAGNFKNPFLYNNVNLTEQFSPLIRLDMEMQNSFKILAEWKKDRALSLSFANNLLTEISGNEYIIGLGYRLSDLKISTKIAGKKQILRGDLNFRADLSLRQNETLIRYLDIDNTQITAGQDIYGIKFTSDYALSKNLTALLFYDHTFSKYSISTAFPQTTIRGGFTLRYNFGN